MRISREYTLASPLHLFSLQLFYFYGTCVMIQSIQNEKGMTLISSLVGAVIVSITLMALQKMLQNARLAERGVASNLDLNEITNTLHLMTDSSHACSNSGLVGLDTTPLFQEEGSVIPVSLSLSNAAGAEGQVLLAAGTNFGGSREIERLELISLAPSNGPGGKSYIGTLRLATKVVGKATTGRSPEKSFSIGLTLDPDTKKITTCGASRLSLVNIQELSIGGAAVQVTDPPVGQAGEVSKPAYDTDYTPLGEEVMVSISAKMGARGIGRIVYLALTIRDKDTGETIRTEPYMLSLAAFSEQSSKSTLSTQLLLNVHPNQRLRFSYSVVSTDMGSSTADFGGPLAELDNTPIRMVMQEYVRQ